MRILDEKHGNSGGKKPPIVFTAWFKPDCRFAKLQLNCQLTPNFYNKNLVPNNKTCSLVKIKKSLPNNKNLVPNNKNLVPNNKKKLVPNNKNSVPNNKNSVPNNNNSVPNNKKQTLIIKITTFLDIC